MRNLVRRRTRPAVHLAVWALALAACARNPVTGKTEISLVSESQEIEMGRQGAQEVEQSIGLVDNDALQQYVQRVGADLARGTERPNLPWTFRVVDDPTPNAFALPGGYIFVTRGLMGLMQNEAELASVLGHEIGHVTARHQVRAITRAQLGQLALGIGSILSPTVAQLGQIAGTGMQLLFLKYDRAAETQADELGFRYAGAGHYDVREMPRVFEALQRLEEREGTSPLPSWLQTHPGTAERITHVQQLIAKAPPAGGTVGSAQYLDRIDGLVYGANPRHGFFRDATFLHPDLRFRIQFPAGWATQNLAQSVAAASPRQDAVIELTLAPGAPDQAMRTFAAQQGVQVGDVSSESINGIPAAVGVFQAQSQQGTLQGYIAYLQYNGNTYQIAAYTPAGAFGTYDRAFRETIRSFAPLTDPSALAVQPNRIAIVRLAAATTLAAFNQRSPSAVPLDELAIINQVPSANATLPAGTIVKRVVKGAGG
ncbi:MAG: M48 family metalloprotease [Gemmatimonadetes bacterium]|nr:M48 family metalloprotease [Gemmatimonadota bacterium]